MNRGLWILGLAILSACQAQNPEGAIKTAPESSRAAYILQPSPFRDEYIEGNIVFMAPGVRGQNHITFQYELQIRNNISNTFILERIDIIDPTFPEVSLKSYGGELLAETFSRPGLRPPVGNLELSGNGSGVANLTLSLPKGVQLGEVFHRLTFGNGEDGNDTKYVLEVARQQLPPVTTLEIGPPVEPGRWAYFTLGHRNTRQLIEGAPIYPQRFALDMAMVGPDGNFAKDDSLANESFLTYGQNILAVDDGIVLAVLDGLEENDPASGELAFKMTRETAGGNYVLQDIGDGLNAFYAHLIPGSLLVKSGDVVKRGDVLGKLGNSGNSDAPHLHLHIELASSLKRPTSGEGVPFIFNSAVEIDRFSPVKLNHVFETNRLLEAEPDLTLEPDNVFLQNGLLGFE